MNDGRFVIAREKLVRSYEISKFKLSLFPPPFSPLRTLRNKTQSRPRRYYYYYYIAITGNYALDEHTRSHTHTHTHAVRVYSSGPSFPFQLPAGSAPRTATLTRRGSQSDCRALIVSLTTTEKRERPVHFQGDNNSRRFYVRFRLSAKTVTEIVSAPRDNTRRSTDERCETFNSVRRGVRTRRFGY